MSEETTEVPNPEDEPKGMRATIESQSASMKSKDDEIAGLRQTIMQGAYDGLGLNTETGLGKAIAKEYDGEATAEALTAYAKDEYGYEFTPVEGQHPQAQQIVQGQAALDQVTETAGSIATPNAGDTLAQAEAAGDYDTALQIKGQQIADMLKTGR